MTNRPIRVLLIDGNVDDSRWIQDLIADFDDGRFAGGWMQGMELFHLECLADALTLLGDDEAKKQFDVVLLNPTLSDSDGLHSYLRLRNSAPEIPVVIASEQDDPDLAVSMARAGAQDFLPKATLDVAPLARSLRLAVERSRILSGLRALTWKDEATGLLNRGGFDLQADHDLAVARRHAKPLALIGLIVDGLDSIARDYGRPEEQLALIEIGELLRVAVDEPACVARIGSNQFAVALLPLNETDVHLRLATIERRFHRFAMGKANRNSLALRSRVSWRHPGANLSVQDLLDKALCENDGGTDQLIAQLARSAGRNL